MPPRPPAALVIAAILSAWFAIASSNAANEKAKAIEAAKPIDWSDPYGAWLNKIPHQDWPMCVGKPGCTNEPGAPRWDSSKRR